MSVWDENKIKILRENCCTMTASALAAKIGGVSRNAVIGKSHRLGLATKIIKRSKINHSNQTNYIQKNINRKSRKIKFRSLLLDKNFEPAKNLSLEELTENTCKYSESDPDKPDFSFCGRKTIDKFSYCPLHLIVVFQQKSKQEDLSEDEEVPEFIEKKI